MESRVQRRVAVAALALCAALPATAVAAGLQPYALDPVHTRVMFAIGHAGFSKAIGTVSGTTGTLLFDPDDWRGARLDVRVPVARLDLGDAKWNEATLARNLLDGERHPEARFVSNEIHPVDAGSAQVCGELSLRGVTRPLCLDVILNVIKRHPMPPFRRTAGFSATATFSRKAFGIDSWPNVIGDTVDLRIEVEAVRARTAAAGMATPETAPGATAAAPAAHPQGPDPTPEDEDADTVEPPESYVPPDPLRSAPHGAP